MTTSPTISAWPVTLRVPVKPPPLYSNRQGQALVSSIQQQRCNERWINVHETISHDGGGRREGGWDQPHSSVGRGKVKSCVLPDAGKQPGVFYGDGDTWNSVRGLRYGPDVRPDPKSSSSSLLLPSGLPFSSSPIPCPAGKGTVHWPRLSVIRALVQTKTGE